MKTLYGKSDRAKASEHAIFLLRELQLPAAKIAGALEHVPKRLGKTLALTVPSRPATVPVRLAIERSGSDWRIEVQTVAHRPPRGFFEGVIRLESAAPNVTRVVLLGRFTYPHADFGQYVDEDATDDFAEDNVIRIFESVLLEVGSIARAKPHASLN